MGRRRKPKKIGYDAGLSCPQCGCTDYRVRITRREEESIYRYRTCRNCGRTVHTQETVDKERTGGYED